MAASRFKLEKKSDILRLYIVESHKIGTLTDSLTGLQISAGHRTLSGHILPFV